MLAIRSYFIGLAVVHAVWFYFFTTGLLVRSVSGQCRSFSVADLVVTSVAGMALSGFTLLLLGFAHLFNPIGIAIIPVVEALLFWLIRGDNWLSWGFWRGTGRRFIESWTLPAIFVYLLFLFLAVPAVVPYTSADSVGYHLPYAADWANAGRIYVDQFLRFPYYANNFLLFYSAFFVLKLGDYCNFLTWLCGLLTCLGVLAFCSPANAYAGKPLTNTRFQPQQFLIPVSVALNPIFLRVLNNSYVDVPIGLFILVPILCAYKASADHPFEGELVVTSAFCAGMKLTLIGHVPFFLLSLVVACWRRLPLRRIALLGFALISLSLPWYLRNLSAAGDPTPPVFNFYFNRPDPVFSKADVGLYTGDTMTERKPFHLLILPFKFFADPTSKNFREPCAPAMTLLLYAPILFLSSQLFLRHRWRSPPRLIYLSAAVAYLAFPWFFSSLGRYSLHWYPVLAAWVGATASYISVSAQQLWTSRSAMRTIRIATVAFCCTLILSNPVRGWLRFYQNYYAQVIHLLRLGGSRERYLQANLHGYLASKDVIEALAAAQKKQTHVLVLGTEKLHFYFRKNANIISVGDYFGPARYRSLLNELQYSDDCPDYLTRLDISAVIIPPIRAAAWWPRFYSEFQARLTRCGYKRYQSEENNIAIFLRRDIKPSGRLEAMPE